MNTFGSVKPIACRSSYVRNCTGSGVRIAPMRAAARYTTTSSTMLGSCTMTISSRRCRRRAAPGEPVDGGLELAVGQALRLTWGQRSAVRRVYDGDRLRRAAHVLEEQIGEGLVPHQPRAVYSATRSGDSRIIVPPGAPAARRTGFECLEATFVGVVRSGGGGRNLAACRAATAQPPDCAQKLAHPVREDATRARRGVDHRHARGPCGEQQAVAATS